MPRIKLISSMTRYVGYLCIWLVLVLIFAAVVGKRVEEYYRLDTRGVVAEGNAISQENHMQIRYSFKVDNKEYVGVGRTGVGTPRWKQVRAGNVLVVHYLPERPDINCIGDPHQLFSDDLISAVVVTLAFPTAVTALIALRLPVRRRRTDFKQGL